jgi:hypothetical protein
MLTQNNTVSENRNLTLLSQPQSVNIRPGQIWRDGNKNRQGRYLLVNQVGTDSAAVQDLSTGKTSKVRKEQFNRGRTGFFYECESKQMFNRFKDIIQLHKILALQ